MKSDTISELVKALTAFQGKMMAVKKDTLNPFYKKKYASLDTIWDAIRKPLSENGLSVTQTMGIQGEVSTLETTLYHTSGEWISGSMLVKPVKDDPQSLGSAISYARRYSISALLGIVADEDNDAEIATGKEPAVKTPAVEDTTSTDAQRKKIFATAKQMGYPNELLQSIMIRTFGVGNSKRLTKSQASEFIELISQGYALKPEEGKEEKTE